MRLKQIKKSGSIPGNLGREIGKQNGKSDCRNGWAQELELQGW